MSARIALLAGLVLCALSCAGDGVATMVTEPPPKNAPTLTELQASIFTPKCAVVPCHVPPAPEQVQGLDLSAGHTYTFTVGVDAHELSGTFKRILPNDAANSYLYMKIAGDSRIVPERMPRFADALTAEEIESVRLWIDAGALDN